MKVYLCMRPDYFVLYDTKAKVKRANPFKLKPIDILPNMVLVGHYYLQQVRADFLDHHILRYQMYSLSSGLPALVVISYEYNVSHRT